MECERLSMSCQLDRIADAMTGFDWNTFVATLIATIVGALAASFIGLVVARAERPQPYFRVDTMAPSESWWTDEDGHTQISVRLWNIGDGPAYNVSLKCSGGAHGIHEATQAKLDPGEFLRGVIWVPAHGSIETDVETLNSVDRRSVTWPTHALALVRWHQPPQRSRQRHTRFELHSPLNRPAAD